MGAAVLIRALQPIEGLAAMRARRSAGMRAPRDRDLCSGPGRLTQALGVSLEQNGSSLSSGPVLIGARGGEWLHPRLLEGTRIGITRAVELRWRYCAACSQHVSSPRPREHGPG